MVYEEGPHAIERTDPRRWRLKCHEGRQNWHYLATDEECEAWPPTAYDRYWLGLPTVSCNRVKHTVKPLSTYNTMRV